MTVPRTIARAGARRDRSRSERGSTATAFDAALRTHAARAESARTPADGSPVLDAEWSELLPDASVPSNAPHAIYARTCLLGRNERAPLINYYA